jgi:GGDEF domain-containing protein
LLPLEWRLAATDTAIKEMSDTTRRLERRWALYNTSVGGAFWLLLLASLVVFRDSLPPFAEIAPLLALAIAGEELVVRQQARAGGAVLSFSAIAHIAAAILLGPLTAAAVAALAVVIVDGSRPAGRRLVPINSAMLGSSIWVGAELYRITGGSSDFARLRLILPLLLLVAGRYLVTTVLFVAGAALSSGRSFGQLFRDVALDDLGPAVGEGSLGILVAFGMSAPHRWIVLPLLAPLLIALYRSKARLEQLKDETSKALESLAHVIDERDPSTSEHTERVAAYVDRFLGFIGVSDAKRDRLLTAAKFHDLGKIAVDVATLSKAGRLAPSELEAIRRHPRLSAFLLSPFHFARHLTLFVELHHERYDGHGYYGVPGAEIPIEAHVLIAADSFDAMTSERPYRPALSNEEAAQELLDKAETQFHPLVARAFVAMVRGEPIEDALRPNELRLLRRAFSSPSQPLLSLLRVQSDPRAWMVVSTLTAMILFAIASVPSWLTATVAGTSGICGCWWIAMLVQARRRERSMLESLVDGARPGRALEAAGISGWVAWLASDAGRTRYQPLEVDDEAVAPKELVAEACRHALRHEATAEVPLSSGAWLQLTDLAGTDLRFALLLQRQPSSVERHLVDLFVEHVTPPELEQAVAPAAGRRTQLPTRRAVLLLDLAVFERVRLVAGQLSAERVVNEAERRLKELLRSSDSIKRIGDDKFGVAALVPDELSLDAVRSRIAACFEGIRVPHGAAEIAPQIVGAFGDEIAGVPELRALDEKLSPYARALVAAS